MTDHCLDIRRFQTRLSFTGLREDAATLGRDVTLAVRELLPEATGRALEPLLGSREGVLRIDRLRLTLRLGRGEVTAAGLAHLLAAELAGQVAQRADGSNAAYVAPGVAFWPDHASFAAAYLAHRLRLSPAPTWAFGTFQPLSQLTADEAALELITARPSILAALARLLGAAGASRLAASLPEASVRTLIARLLEHERAELSEGEERELVAILAEVPIFSPAEGGRAILEEAFTSLAASSTDDVETVRRAVHVARLAVALATLRETVARAWGRALTVADFTPDALIHLPEAARSFALAPLLTLAASGIGRETLARVLTSGSSAGPGAARPPLRAEEALVTPALTSRVAGIGLLLPTLLAHRVHDQLTPGALHRLLSAALGPEEESVLRKDALLAALAPCDPREATPAFPPVPEVLRALIPEALRGGENAEPGLFAAEGAAAWAGCLIHGFAAGLPGLELSTLGYLRRQFLARPGTLRIADERLTLVLDPVPLGVVLRLSGVHGWSGRLPHGQLRIEIREA